MTERWITDEDEPLLIVDSKGEYESISVLYREDAPTVRGLLNDYDEKYIDEFSLRETLQLELQRVEKENEQLKQSIKQIDDAELHLKQIILKRIDDYIWEWEDEGTPVAQVLKELRDEIKGDVE